MNTIECCGYIIKTAVAGLLLSCSSWLCAEVFFSEYIEGSGNNKALEIYNGGSGNLDLTGYEVQMFFNGSASAGRTIALQGTIAPGDVFVLAHSAAAPAVLAAADQQAAGSWYNGNDAVALLFGGSFVDVIGQIGVDPGAQWGSGDLSTTNRTLRRQPWVTQGDSDGYDAFDPAAEWLGFPQDTFDGLGTHDTDTSPCSGDCNGGGEPQQPGVCGDPATRIHAIQGAGFSSPLVGTVHSIEAVVVGDFQGSERLSGFFVQERDDYQDQDPLTSEGIFVFSGNNPAQLQVGDLVRITGPVSEYFDMTQISANQVQICASGLSVTPAVLTLPVTGPLDLERLEGMAVVVPQTLTVTENYNLGRFGELVLSANGRLFNPTQIAEPGAEAQMVAADNALRRILLDDGSTRQNPALIPYPAPALSAFNTVRSGDTVQGLQGVMHYAFSEYRIQPTQTPVFVADNPRPVAPSLPAAGSLRVASFNVLNYFNGDGLGGGFPTARGASSAEEFVRQRDKIIAALVAMDADIVGLIEIENNGFGPQSAIQDLVNGLANEGLDYAIVDPGTPQIGTDAITVGFIYKPDSVELLNPAAILDGSVDPRFIDSKNRPILAQTFREIRTQGVLTLAVGHLKSKGSSCDDISDPDVGDGQGNCNRTRQAATAALADWLATDPTGSGDSDFLIIGDLNAYAKEDPITTLEQAGYTNLLAQLLGEHTYSYVFTGLAGYLDHALASPSLVSQVTGVADWHINADEPRVLDYNVEFKTAAQIIELYHPDPFRSSDHDPLIVQLELIGAILPTLPGDFNGDGRVDLIDLLHLLLQLGKTVTDDNRHFDLNGDNKINARDLTLWLRLLANH